MRRPFSAGVCQCERGAADPDHGGPGAPPCVLHHAQLATRDRDGKDGAVAQDRRKGGLLGDHPGLAARRGAQHLAAAWLRGPPGASPVAEEVQDGGEPLVERRVPRWA